MYLYLIFCIFVLYTYSCFIVLLQVSTERDCCHIQASQSPPVTHSSRHFSGAPVSMGFKNSSTRDYLLILRIKTFLECSQPSCQLAHFWCSQPSCANMLCFHAIQYICSFSTIYIATQGKTKHNTIYNVASPAVLISPPQRWDNIWDPHCEQSRQSRKW